VTTGVAAAIASADASVDRPAAGPDTMGQQSRKHPLRLHIQAAKG